MRKLRAILFVAIAAASAEAAPPNAVMLSIACDGCHGTLGISADAAMPSIAGQTKEYLVATMKKFRSGERPSTMMGRLARGYSDAEIEAMGAFYARLKPVRQGGAVDAKLAARGQIVFYRQCKYCHLDRGPLWRQIHRNRDYDNQCRHCHADYGNDVAEPTPFIAGQGPQYLSLQLADFKTGARPMSKAKAQRLKSLSPEDLEAVVRFYASQPLE